MADYFIRLPKIAHCIFSYLSPRDLRECALVSRSWYYAVKDARSKSILHINLDLWEQLKESKKTVPKYVDENYKYVSTIVIHGHSKSGYLPNEAYDSLFESRSPAKNLILQGRGVWDSCHCPTESDVFGSQYDNVQNHEKTNLCSIFVGETFAISACALLELVSRSPKLKTIKFEGLIIKNDHEYPFANKTFHCHLERLYWPFPNRRQLPTLAMIVKKNDDLATLYSSMETVCDLLSAEQLTKVRYLSLNLNENWCKPKNKKKIAYQHLERIKCLSMAKSVEALEMRTFEFGEVSEDQEVAAAVERIYETYKLTIWMEVAKLPNLRYLAIYGAWELEKVCQEISKNALGLEYFKTNLSPSSLIRLIDQQNDNLVLSMGESIKDLRRLASLRSIHYVCSDKLATISNQTIVALKELFDIIWVFDVKTCFTPEVEDLLNNILRRGNQLGKVYKVDLHVQPKNPIYADILSEHLLRINSSKNVRSYLNSIAEYLSLDRYGKEEFENYQIWGLRLAGITNNRGDFERTKAEWKNYEDNFNPTLNV